MAKDCVIVWFEEGDDREAMLFFDMPCGTPFSHSWFSDLRMQWVDALDLLQVPDYSPCQHFSNVVSVSIGSDSVVWDSDYIITMHTEAPFARAHGGTWCRGE